MSDRSHAIRARGCLERQESAAPSGAGTDVPDSWDEQAWEDTLDDAREHAGLDGSAGTLTTKTINGHDHYLQWREGKTVESQYVAPVDPT